MTGIVLAGVFEVGTTQTIDRNLLRGEEGEGRVSEYPNVEFPKSIIGFGGSEPGTEHDLLALKIDTGIPLILADFEISGGLDNIFLAHIAFLSTV